MAATYLDSSAIVKLVIREPESTALRRFLRTRRPLVSSALARTEVLRALLPLGEQALERGREALSRLDLVRISDQLLGLAGTLKPTDVRSLDAIHLATARLLGAELGRVVTYDHRMADAARELKLRVSSPK